MRNTFFASLVLLSSFALAQLNLIAIIHPGCSHCQAWEADWGKNESALKDQFKLKVVDVTNFDDVQWVENTFPDTFGPTPTFLVVSENKGKQTLLEKFSGYPNWSEFEKMLTQSIPADA